MLDSPSDVSTLDFPFPFDGHVVVIVDLLLSISKDTCLPRERLLALAIDDFRGPCGDDDNFSGEEIGSGDSGGKVGKDWYG